MLQPLDGPSKQYTISVDTSTVKEIKFGSSTLSCRKVITLQPIDGKIYVYFGDDTISPPNSSTVINDGMIVFKNAKESFEAGEKQPVYILSLSGTVNVKVVERA